MNVSQWAAVSSDEVPTEMGAAYFERMAASPLPPTAGAPVDRMAAIHTPPLTAQRVELGHAHPSGDNQLSIAWSQTPDAKAMPTKAMMMMMPTPTSYHDQAPLRTAGSPSSSQGSFSPATSSMSISPEQYRGSSVFVSEEEKKKKQSLMLRRKRNRESMRRSRLREKEALTSLIDTLEALERQHEALMGTTQASQSKEELAQVQRIQHKLAELIQCRRRLEAENQAVLHMIGEKEQFLRELQHVFNDFQLDDRKTMLDKLLLLDYQHHRRAATTLISRSLLSATPADTAVAASTANSVYDDPFFSPLSGSEVNNIISKFCDNIEYVRSIGLVASKPFLEVFGWHTRRQVDEENQMHFEFAKCFRHLSVEEVTRRSWEHGIDLESYKKKEDKVQFRRLEFLQRVNDDICVVVREIDHPDDAIVFRTHYMIFRIATADGFALGLQSINPINPDATQIVTDDGEKSVVWIDVSICVEFFRHTCPQTQEQYCEVRWRGKTNYKSLKHACDNAVQFLLGVLRWENNIIGPRFTLTSS